MSSNLNPYLNFDDDARAALEFYQSVFGGDLNVMTFADAGGMGVPEAEQTKVMHGQLDVDGTPLLMAADRPSHIPAEKPGAFSVSLSGDDDATLRGWWDALSDGATITQPLETAPWGDSFGMLTDRFGTPWLVNISGGAAQG